ncbi:outer membrane beta-barrel protein [Rufibacter immobilis]|uniref:outer membrane beta-barrel protein n=1 Tax=Rufibacter immobilis TaxID=1348778 RepID=UPI0035EF6ED2
MKKSPAEKDKGQSVEDIFRQGFAGAESTPPTRIWEGIGRELENHELQRYKQQVKWYRSIAAVFLLLLTSAGVVLWRQNTSSPLGTGSLATQAPKQSQENKQLPAPAAKETIIANEGQNPAQTSDALAAVSGPILEKEPLNANQAQKEQLSQEAGRTKRRNWNNPRTTNASAESSLARKEEAFAGALASVGPAAESSAPEGLGEASQASSTQQTEEAVLTKAPVINAMSAKPFTRDMANNLAIDKGLPVAGNDSSLAMVPKRTIMAQKEPENPAVLAQQPQLSENQGIDKKEENDFYKWSLNMSYTPQYAYNQVKIGQSAGMSEMTLAQPQMYEQYHSYQEAVEEYNKSYNPAYSYSAMVGASYRINEKWQIESGIMYAQNEATTTHSYLVYASGASASSPNGFVYANMRSNKSAPLAASALTTRSDVSTQNVFVSRTDQYNTKYKYQQVGLPLRLAYRLNMKKLYAYFAGGVNLSVLVQNSIIPETDQVAAVEYGFNDKDSPFKTLQWATSTAIGLGYDVSRKMSILVAPEFTYSLTPMVREEQQQANAYQLGVSIGGRWRLTK